MLCIETLGCKIGWRISSSWCWSGNWFPGFGQVTVFGVKRKHNDDALIVVQMELGSFLDHLTLMLHICRLIQKTGLLAQANTIVYISCTFVWTAVQMQVE